MNNDEKLLQYTTLFNIVKTAIANWNPYGLFPDAPENEFDNEVTLILAKLRINQTIEEIAAIISVVFLKNFANDKIFTSKKCYKVASDIKKQIDYNFRKPDLT